MSPFFEIAQYVHIYTHINIYIHMCTHISKNEIVMDTLLVVDIINRKNQYPSGMHFHQGLYLIRFSLEN